MTTTHPDRPGNRQSNSYVWMLWLACLIQERWDQTW